MRKMVLIGLACALAACGTIDVTNALPKPTPATLAGTYGLTTINGAPLPFALLDVETYHIQMVGATLSLNSNNTYLFVNRLRVDDSGRIRSDSVPDTGTWNLTNEVLTLTSSNASSFVRTATVSGNTMTMQSSTYVFVLKK